MSDSPRGVFSLIAIPALLTLLATIVRLYGELQGWDPAYFSPKGGPSWFGITWLVPIFGAWFGWRLMRQRQAPMTLARPAGLYLLGVLVCAGGMYGLIQAGLVSMPDADKPGKFEGGSWILLLVGVGFVIALLAWTRLTLVLVAYGFLARIPVMVVTYLDIDRGWETHYGDLPPGVLVADNSEALMVLLTPQFTLWPLAFTPLIGGLFGCLGARIARR